MTTTKKIIKHLLILLSVFILLFSLYVSLTNRQVILVPEKAPVCNNSHLHFIYKPNQTESICFEPEIVYDGLFFSFFLDMDKSITYFKAKTIAMNVEGLGLAVKKAVNKEADIKPIENSPKPYTQRCYQSLNSVITTLDLRMDYKQIYGRILRVNGMFRKFRKAMRVVLTVEFEYGADGIVCSDSVSWSFIPRQKVSWRFIDEAESI